MGKRGEPVSEPEHMSAVETQKDEKWRHENNENVRAINRHLFILVTVQTERD